MLWLSIVINSQLSHIDNNTNRSETGTIRAVLRIFSFRVHTTLGHSNDNNSHFSGKATSNCLYSRTERGICNFKCLISENIVLNTGFYNLVDYFNLEMGKNQGKSLLLNIAADFT